MQLCRAGFTVILNRAACRGVAADTTELALQKMASAGIQIVAQASAIGNLL
jgi:nicotinamidase/pyrazinamidase